MNKMSTLVLAVATAISSCEANPATPTKEINDHRCLENISGVQTLTRTAMKALRTHGCLTTNEYLDAAHQITGEAHVECVNSLPEPPAEYFDILSELRNAEKAFEEQCFPPEEK